MLCQLSFTANVHVVASLENHGSTPIKNGERLVYSFGALIKNEQVNKIFVVFLQFFF